MDRFAMATALLARARSHKDWIGDDHGDRYEQAMLSASVPDEMQIVVKEILDHLRAALDYCAQQIWISISGQPQGAKIYFPIARQNAKDSDFLSIMNRQMPGVAAASSEAVTTLMGFQAFADPTNAWLPELATLVNQTKHDHLLVASMPRTIMNILHSENGTTLMSLAPGHEIKRGAPWMMIKADEAGLKAGGDFEVVFLQLKEIKMELSSFLREAIAGVEKIIEACRKLAS